MSPSPLNVSIAPTSLPIVNRIIQMDDSNIVITSSTPMDSAESSSRLVSNPTTTTPTTTHKKNRFFKSYGLVVKTQYPPHCVVLVERKFPYCIVNRLIRQAKKDILNTNENPKTRSKEKDWRRQQYPQRRRIANRIKQTVARLNSRDFRDDSQHDFGDFVRYKFKLPFEDKYDFPHGQMQKRIKRFVSFTRGDGGSISEKLAGFLTAFMEFEEETGYTFRFDFKMIQKQCREITIQFTGSDGYEYQQCYYIVRVDKLSKLNQSSSQKFNFFMGTRQEQYFQRELDRLQFIPRLLKLKDAEQILVQQQEEIKKMDRKHILLNESFYEDDKTHPSNEYLNLRNYNSFEEEGGDKTNSTTTTTIDDENEQENIFLNFIRRVEPDIYKRCVRKSKWRDKS